MASPVVAVVLMVGINFLMFGSLVVFATTNHYEQESCDWGKGWFRSIWDTKDCEHHWSQKRAEYAELCRCEPPIKDPLTGEPCKPVLIGLRFIGWSGCPMISITTNINVTEPNVS